MNSNFGQSNGFFDLLDDIPVFFKIFGGLVFALVFGGFLYIIIRGLTMWISNNAAELARRTCKVIDKRTEVWGGSGDSSANTNYYITFEFEDRTRIELYVRPQQFGLITIGDTGDLTYQGKRFKQFNRDL
ncbi:DUF2500 domain-containing protein [Cohnella sp. AR92]|uniref:DUF2500 domain-containing protein n=1 Tax=Cohnella sp. AR92 TaxID=648716 RepID=UPI000F8F3B65|nr:DUF2500 domain-containing protein [Cohnella sp. AR92]RUS45436.1 DUF2500 domain-containing protein [Cohnella sp. AR92]